MKYKVRINNPVIGVPITFLDKFDPNQFEILGCCEPALKIEDSQKVGYHDYPSRQIMHDGKLCQKTYHRILIRWKPEAMPNIDEDGVITYD